MVSTFFVWYKTKKKYLEEKLKEAEKTKDCNKETPL